MKQPVRVGLYFPRSGQELFVQLPIPVAETAEKRRLDYKSSGAQTTSAAAFTGSISYGENAPHTR